MSQMKLLDLFCKAGGAGAGYHEAGFEVVGVDIEPQPNYPFEFHQGDALEYLALHGHEFDAIHASPPCQEYSVTSSLKTKQYPTLIEPVRELLVKSRKPYIIENVPGAPLINPLMLCGTMFGLRVIRHRYFENNIDLHFAPFACNHWGKTQPRNDKRTVKGAATLKHYSFITVVGHDFRKEDASIAMGINWMTSAELAEAIPPAYTKYIGGFLLARAALLSNNRLHSDARKSAAKKALSKPVVLSTQQGESTPASRW